MNIWIPAIIRWKFCQREAVMLYAHKSSLKDGERDCFSFSVKATLYSENHVKSSQKHWPWERTSKGWRVASGKAKWEVAPTGATSHHYLERSLVVRVKNSEIAVLNLCYAVTYSLQAPGHHNTFIIKFFKFPNYFLWRSTSSDTFGLFDGSDLVSVLFQSLSGFVHTWY